MRLRRKSFAVAFGLVVAIGGTVAVSTAEPGGAQPLELFMVSPSTGLVNGQTVQLSGSNLQASTAYVFEECLGEGGITYTASICDATTAVTATTDGSGTLANTPYSVNQNINPPSGSVNCLSTNCVIAALPPSGSTLYQPISFAGGGSGSGGGQSSPEPVAVEMGLNTADLAVGVNSTTAGESFSNGLSAWQFQLANGMTTALNDAQVAINTTSLNLTNMSEFGFVYANPNSPGLAIADLPACPTPSSSSETCPSPGQTIAASPSSGPDTEMVVYSSPSPQQGVPDPTMTTGYDSSRVEGAVTGNDTAYTVSMTLDDPRYEISGNDNQIGIGTFSDNVDPSSQTTVTGNGSPLPLCPQSPGTTCVGIQVNPNGQGTGGSTCYSVQTDIDQAQPSVQYSLNFEENETTSGCPSGTPAVRMSATSQPHTTTTSCSDNGMTCAATLSDPTLGNVTFSVGSGQGVTSFQTSQAVQYVLQYASPPPPQTTVSGRVTEPNGTVFPSSGAAGCPVGEPLVQGCPGFVVGFANPAGFYSMNVVPGISYNVVGFANGPSGLVLSVPVAVTLNAGETVTENFLVPVPTTVNYTGATQGAVGDPALVSATLTNDVSGSPVASELISFAVGSASCSATTNASGSAACILVPAGPPGASTVAANFAGNSQYFMSSNTMPFTVLGATCALCVLRPSAAPALSLTGNGSVSVSGSVAVNSSGKPAASLTGNGTVTATQIGGPGAPSQFNVTGNGRFSPTPVAESAVPDPLAALPECPDTAFPPNPCSTTVQSNVALTGNGSATINPGIYQSISLTGNGKLTLNPGVYVITGSLSVTGNGSLSGSGVTLYLACSTYPTPCATGKSGASFSLTGNGTVNLSAPTSGPFQGVSIFADRNNTATNTLTGNGSTIGGTIYAESANLTLTGNGQMLIGRLIVNMLTLTGNGSVTIG